MLREAHASEYDRRVPVALEPGSPDLLLLRSEGEVARDESTVDESVKGERFADWQESEDVGERVVGQAGELLRVVCRVARRQPCEGARSSSR